MPKTILPAKFYTFAVPANGTVNLPVNGSFFKIISATGVVDVTLDSVGTLDSLLAGQGMRDTPFQQLQLRDRTGAINTVRVLIADEFFVDDRVSGEVSVIDGGKARTLAGSAFSLHAYQTNVAAQYPHCGLYNTGGSGKNLFVEQILVSVTVANAYCGIYSGVTGGWGSSALGKSKKIGGAASTCGTTYLKSTVGVDSGTATHGQLAVPTTQTAAFKFSEPMCIPPGSLLFLAMTNAANGDLGVTYEWYEETI